jgi:hypothetical protein
MKPHTHSSIGLVKHPSRANIGYAQLYYITLLDVAFTNLLMVTDKGMHTKALFVSSQKRPFPASC